MLDRSTKFNDSLMDAYNSIHELHKGHASGSSDLEKQASQLASDIRYKAKGKFKEGTNAEDKKRIYLSLLSSSSAPAIVKQKAKKKLLGESVLGEEGYDRMKDQHLERGGIGAVASKSPSRPYTRSEKQPKGKTVLQKETEAKYGKGRSALDIVKQKITDKYGKGAIQDSTAPAVGKIINSIREDSKYGYDAKGRSKNPKDIKRREDRRKKVSEGKLVHGPFGPYITGQKLPREHKETPLAKVPYETINSAKKVVGEAKYDNTKSPDYAKKKKALAKKHGGEENIKGHPQYEEVGVSSSAEMKKAQDEAKLRKKEQDAVKKEKKALKREEVAPAVEKVIESIKINKCTPASPNVVIMPKKDDITDKAGGKTTKDVVSKKHKQFFNKEDKVKTFRQFVTETEQIDELAALAKLAKVGKGAANLAKGTAQMGSQLAQKSVTQVGKVVQGAGRLGGDVVKHGGDALQKGAETMKKTGSISTGVNKFGTEFSKSRIIAQGRAPIKGITGAAKTKTSAAIVDTDKLNKMAKLKWKGTKKKL